MAIDIISKKRLMDILQAYPIKGDFMNSVFKKTPLCEPVFLCVGYFQCWSAVKFNRCPCDAIIKIMKQKGFQVNSTY